MNKPISPRLHSIIDYGFLAGNLVLPRMIGASTATCRLFAGFGLVQGTLNALTVQPFAVKKVVPFPVHGLVEKSSLPVYLLAPLVAKVHRDPRGRAYWIALGVILVAVYNLTDWSATRPGR